MVKYKNIEDTYLDKIILKYWTEFKKNSSST